MPHPAPPAEPASFEDLYAEHGPRVLRLLGRLGVSDADWEDVAQEVWTTAHRSLASFDSAKGTARAWLSGIARNAARAHRRKQERRVDVVTLPEHEMPASPTEGADKRISDTHRRAAIWLFLARAIPSEEQREAFLLHVIEGLTVEEVAMATGVGTWTAQWRIRMARSKLRAAEKELTDDEREQMRAVLLPLGGVDGLIRTLRDTPVHEDEVARVWDRVVDQIEADGGSIHDRLGSTQAPTPAGYTITGGRLASGAAAFFLLGALSGAIAHALLTPHVRTSMVPIEAEVAPLPLSPIAPTPAPSPSTTATATATTTSTFPVRSVPIAGSALAAWETERALLERARTALLEGAPSQALDHADDHARLFPRSSAAAMREEIAIRALVQLGRPAEAKERADKLLRWAPQMRAALEARFGRSFF